MGAETEPRGGLPAEAYSLQAQLADQQPLDLCVDGFCLSYACSDSLWLTLKNSQGTGFALRTGYGFGEKAEAEIAERQPDRITLRMSAAVGVFEVAVSAPRLGQAIIHVETTFTPAADLLITSWPRDLFPIGADGAATETEGRVHAAQRGLNTGLLFLTLEEPRFGSLLYWQDFSRLNPYFAATGNTPDTTVGGDWPELGYAPPTSVDGASLKEGEAVVTSSVYLHPSAAVPSRELDAASLFVSLVNDVYHVIDHPDTTYFDWPLLAQRSLSDLKQTDGATVERDGNLYIRPYIEAEPIESMTQLAVFRALHRWAKHWDNRDPFIDRLWEAVPTFYDSEIGVLRRYLPDVEGKDYDKADSWYVYHPLASLGRLVKNGFEEGRELFFACLPYAIKAAQRFQYRWPVFFHYETLEVIRGGRDEGQPGETDVAGLYCVCMHIAYELTGESHYLVEAEKALRTTEQWGFEAYYQSNLAANSLVSALRQWQLTGDAHFKRIGEMFYATLLHNSILWESEIANAKDYTTFFGTSCLSNATYMALFECYEELDCLVQCLEQFNGELPVPMQSLMTEAFRYGLNRCRFFYADNLSEEAISDEVENGRILPTAALPLEDLYPDGRPAGSVGQEVYGVGGAFHFATAAFTPVPEAGVILYCESPLIKMVRSDRTCLFRAAGVPQFSYRLMVFSLDSGRKEISVETERGAKPQESRHSASLLEMDITGGDCCRLSWQA